MYITLPIYNYEYFSVNPQEYHIGSLSILGMKAYDKLNSLLTNTELVNDIKKLSTNAQTLVQMDQNMTKAPGRFFRDNWQSSNKGSCL